MVFVTLGTQDKQFQRLLKLVDKEIKDGRISQPVIAQNGNTTFSSDVMHLIPFMDMESFEKNISDADFIICHAGYGTLSTALKYGKKIIAVPRLARYGEHTNDHQLQILEEYERKGFVIALHENMSLAECLEKLHDFTPAPYTDNADRLCALVEKCIDER